MMKLISTFFYLHLVVSFKDKNNIKTNNASFVFFYLHKANDSVVINIQIKN